MRLFIAEKPSLARAIAAAIPGQHRPARRHIDCSTGDVIAWCAGHVLEMAPPEDYSPDLRTWAFESLPIVPDRWQHRVSSPDLLGSIKGLLARANRVVHAGDPDREGQLLVDEVLQHLGWGGPTERLLVTDLSPPAVRRALGALESNERFRPLCDAALARQRADWVYGMNMTRLYTLRARLSGYRGVLSVGRVQTPVLGMIVRRDREIESFVPRPFYVVEATLRTALGAEFVAEWAVGKEHSALTDAEGRLLSRQLAEAVATKVQGQLGIVAQHQQKPHGEAAPLPYSLAELQIDAGRKLGMSAARVLELAQRLYERQRITYPRSDCSHLPEEQFARARAVIEAVRASAPAVAAACAAADLRRRSKAWNDSRITAHHAIIPTAGHGAAALPDEERDLYELVALRFVHQFLAPFEYQQTRVEIALAGETFVARGRQVLALGWKAFDRKPKAPTDEVGEKAPAETILPALTAGEQVSCPAARVAEKTTQPPKAFTDATLIQAMCNVARIVTDPAAKQILQDTDGIGTPATRAAILETLFDRGYVERRKQQIRSTTVGRALIDALPTVATTPDQTAVWETAMRRIHDRQLGLDRFLGAVHGQIAELVARGKAAGALHMPSAAAPPPPPARHRARGRGDASKRTRRAGKASKRAARGAAS